MKRHMGWLVGLLLAGGLALPALAEPLAGVEVTGNNLRIRTTGTVNYQLERNSANEVVLFLPGTETGNLPASQETTLGTITLQQAAGGTRLIFRPRALGATFKVAAGASVGDNQTIEIQTVRQANIATGPAAPSPTSSAVATGGERVTIKVRDGDVRDTLTLLGRVAKANVVTESSVSGRISLNLEKVTFPDAVRAVASVAGLQVTVTEGDVYIVSKPPTSGLTPLPGPPIAPGGTDPAKRPVSFSVKNAELSSVVENISNQAGAQLLIKGTLQDRITGRVSGVPFEEALTQILNGTRYGYVRQGQTYLIGDTTPGTFTAQALEKTEVVPLAYTAAKSVNQLLPATLARYVKVDEKRNAVVISGTDSLRAQVSTALRELDKPLKQVVFEVKVIELSETGSRAFNVVRAFQVPGATGTGTPLSLAGQLTEGAAVGVFNNITRILEVVSGLLNDGRARLLTDTKLSTLSGQKASIKLETDINLRLNQVTNVSGSQFTTANIQTLRAGTVVEIEPTVQGDGNVLANLKVESSIPGPRATQETPPDISRRSVTNTILVKDGQTVEIGGLIQNNTRETVVRIPVLGWLPFIGQLFSTTSSEVEQRELVVFITPRIRDVQPLPGTQLPLEPPR